MSTQLYTVTLTDLGTYRITVAANTANQAEGVALTVMSEEAAKLPKGMTIVDRDNQATAELAAEQPVRQFEVTGTYSIDFALCVPAPDAEEAERHAQRLYQDNPIPFEHATGEERTRWHCAREVVS